MKAIILEKLNSPLLVEELVIPDVLAYGQVLVRMLAATICGAQIGEITGAKGDDPYLPHLLGHEGCGEVVETGVGVTHVKRGDRVVLHWRKGIGPESPLPKYRWNWKVVGGGPVTTFSEMAIVSANRITPIDKDIPPAVASLFGCAVTTALGLINNEAKLKIGQSIAIAGVGGVGLNIVQGARMVSAHPIIAIDKVTSKLEMAVKFGATHVLPTNGGVVQALGGICPKGVDVFVDCTGSPLLADDALRSVAAGGKLILLGQPVAGEPFVFADMRRHYCGKTIMDSQGGLTNPTVDIPRYAELYRQFKLELDSLITNRFPLDKVNDAVALVRSGKAGRVVLEM